MKTNRWLVFIIVVSAGLLIVWGCEGKRPTAPARVASLALTIPMTGQLKASLLGATQDEILYVLRANGSIVNSGTVGPFPATSQAGDINFSVDATEGLNYVLALQLNDGTTHQPLAIGATPLDLTSSSSTYNAAVTLGSVIRDCYNLNPPITIVSSTSSGLYQFMTDTLAVSMSAPAPDVLIQYNTSGYELDDPASNNTLAYLGNDNLVNFAYVPPGNAFFSTSTASKQFGLTTPAYPVASPPVKATPTFSLYSYGAILSSPTYLLAQGDVYCIRLAAGGYAWVQVTNPGSSNSAPTLRYRVNTTVSYYAYQQTIADLQNSCSSSW